MNELLRYVDFVTFKEGVSIWRSEHNREQTVPLGQLENSLDKKYALYFAYVKLIVFETNLLAEKTNVTSALLEYVDALAAYASLYYAKPLLQEKNWCVLPRDCQFALYVKKAFDAKEKNCTAEWTEYMKKAGKIYPDRVSILQSVLKEEAKRIEVAKVSPEMRQLAEELKKNIRALIKVGQSAAAKELVLALEQYVPGDEEIGALKELIGNGM